MELKLSERGVTAGAGRTAIKRRKWGPKALIVLERLEGRPIDELCTEHEVSQAH